MNLTLRLILIIRPLIGAGTVDFHVNMSERKMTLM